MVKLATTTLLTREHFVSGNSWVRAKMTCLLVVSGLVPAEALFYQYFRITPMALEILQGLRDQEGNPGEQLVSGLQDILQQRKRMVIYPGVGSSDGRGVP